MSVIKLRDDKFDDSDGGRVFMSIFSGPDADHLQLAGNLVLQIGEYQEFGASLLLGAQKMQGTFVVLHDDKPFRVWAAKRAEALKKQERARGL